MNQEGTEKPAQKQEDAPRLLGWLIGHVFDVSQTEGQAIPKPPSIEHGPGGKVSQELKTRLDAFVHSRGVKLQTEKLESGHYGFYDSKKIRIVLNEGMSPAHRFSTLCHEAAHALLHSKEALATGGKNPRRQMELEAEAVSYVVCARAGVHTQMDAAAYIALHHRFHNPTDVMTSFHQSMARILKVSNEMIHELGLALDLKQTLAQAQKQAGGPALSM